MLVEVGLAHIWRGESACGSSSIPSCSRESIDVPKGQRGQRLLFVSHDSIFTLDSRLGMGRWVVRWRGKVDDATETDENRSIVGLSVYVFKSQVMER